LHVVVIPGRFSGLPPDFTDRQLGEITRILAPDDTGAGRCCRSGDVEQPRPSVPTGNVRDTVLYPEVEREVEAPGHVVPH
jgi:hypothetical protein